MAYDHIERIEDTQSVSGFADRGMERLKSLLQQPKAQAAERAEAPREATQAAPAREASEPRQDNAVKVTAAPPPVNDTVTLGQHDEQDDNGMGWLSSLTQNYGV